MSQQGEVLSWTSHLQTRKDLSVMGRSRRALAAVTMRCWKLRSWEDGTTKHNHNPRFQESRIWQSTMGYGPGKKRDPWEMVSFQRSSPPNSIMVQSYVWGTEQGDLNKEPPWLNKELLTKPKHKKGGSKDRGGVLEEYRDTAGMGLGKPKPI